MFIILVIELLATGRLNNKFSFKILKSVTFPVIVNNIKCMAETMLLFFFFSHYFVLNQRNIVHISEYFYL